MGEYITTKICFFSVLLLLLQATSCRGFVPSSVYKCQDPFPTTAISTDTKEIEFASRQQSREINDSFKQLPRYKKFNGNYMIATAVLATTFAVATPAFAVSGGGLDYANLDISGQDFSNGNYKGKDFTQVIAKATKFTNSNLQGCRFYKAYLAKADFRGADLRGAALEDTSMNEADLGNAVASGAYFSNSIMETANLENADFTDAQFPVKTLSLLCDRPDVKGTNPKTGADTRESLMCP